MVARTNAERQKRHRQKVIQQKKDNGTHVPRMTSADRLPHNRLGGKARNLPFVGCDGEGGFKDALGRQSFLLFRIGNKELETGHHLTTEQCLDFICEAPRHAILVGFYFGYDTTQILRDLSKERLKRLFNPYDDTTNGHMRWTYYRDFGIRYLPKQFLSVCRLNKSGLPIPGSTRTIYETGGFFQGKFLDQLKNFKIGTEAELEIVKKMKDDRGEFTIMDPEIRGYNNLECVLLEGLMNSFRDSCIDAGIVPRTWNGAGKLAKVMHKSHETITKENVLKSVPSHCLKLSHDAYYGGRFEVTSIGHIVGKIYEYDINSAYPDAMRNLPCLVHGRWVPFGRSGPDAGNDLWIANVLFTHKKARNLYGVPIRDQSGTIYWPRTGNGTYWSVELNSAKKLGCTWKYQEGFQYVKTCSCVMFSWVDDLFRYRKSIGKSGKGYPIKLGLNSLYGTLAQRIGNPKYGNFLYAGLITAYTRAKLNDCISRSPDTILMLATDGVYSTAPIPGIDIGDDLGQWEAKEFPEIFIIKPGLYWTPDKLKTRGVNSRDIDKTRKEFEETWQNFVTSEQNRKGGSPSAPSVKVKTRLFTGLKLAYARGKPETAGTWVEQERKVSFDWSLKRQPIARYERGRALTLPFDGSKELRTKIYSEVTKEIINEMDEARGELHDMPDGYDGNKGDVTRHLLGEKVYR